MDLSEFNQLFTEYQGRFTRFAYSYVRDLTVAEDITIEAMMYFWENRHKLDTQANVPAYILTAIKHKCLNHLEHLRVRNLATETMQEQAAWELQTRISTLEACNPNELFSAEAQAIVDRTLSIFPEQTRNIFIMSRYHNKSHKEIAEALGITTKGVEFHISKVLKELRTNLKDYFPVFLYLFYMS